jgi:hypothetical protein
MEGHLLSGWARTHRSQSTLAVYAEHDCLPALGSAYQLAALASTRSNSLGHNIKDDRKSVREHFSKDKSGKNSYEFRYGRESRD